MNSPPDQGPAERAHKRPRVPLPLAVRSELRHALAENRRLYGSRGYDLLREDERFRPYIGKHLGETGDKRLDRLVRELKALAPSTRSRRLPPNNNIETNDPRPAAVARRDSQPPALSPEQLAGLAQARRGFAEMDRALSKQLAAIDDDLDRCRETGEVVDAKTYNQLLTAYTKVWSARADLGDRFQAQLKNAHYYAAIHQVYADEFADLPDRLARAQAEIGRVTADFGGLPPTTGE